MGAFTFDSTFQQYVLGLMVQDYDFLVFASDFVKPAHFTSEPLSFFFKAIRDHFLDYHTVIDQTALKNELIKSCRSQAIRETEIAAFSEIFNRLYLRIPDQEYIRKEVIDFCRYQTLKTTILDLAPLLEKNQFSEVEGRLLEALNTGADAIDIGIKYYESAQERLIRRFRRQDIETFATGITELDELLGGGIRPKQLGIWMGPPHRGKSTSLIHCGKRQVIAKKKVIHYTLEMSDEDVCDRYDASFCHIPLAELQGNSAKIDPCLRKLGLHKDNYLIVKEFPAGIASVSTIRSHIKKCQFAGFFPDLIIIDYLDLLRSQEKRRERREELTDVTTQVRGLTAEFKLPIWSATQANRSAISLETHTEEQVSEDIGKMAIADIVITINQNRKEVLENILRLFLAKNRNGPKYREVEIKCDFSRACFYDPFKTSASIYELATPPTANHLKLDPASQPVSTPQVAQQDEKSKTKIRKPKKVT